mmetsp:Transcript_11492/g.52028  ORF Transcript_11492/g.52028 Transcript_11492/m.52028 type:complete len:225 (-) Transcript_11492:404-1078(-)
MRLGLNRRKRVHVRLLLVLLLLVLLLLVLLVLRRYHRLDVRVELVEERDVVTRVNRVVKRGAKRHRRDSSRRGRCRRRGSHRRGRRLKAGGHRGVEVPTRDVLSRLAVAGNLPGDVPLVVPVPSVVVAAAKRRGKVRLSRLRLRLRRGRPRARRRPSGSGGRVARAGEGGRTRSRGLTTTPRGTLFWPWRGPPRLGTSPRPGPSRNRRGGRWRSSNENSRRLRR